MLLSMPKPGAQDSPSGFPVGWHFPHNSTATITAHQSTCFLSYVRPGSAERKFHWHNRLFLSSVSDEMPKMDLLRLVGCNISLQTGQPFLLHKVPR